MSAYSEPFFTRGPSPLARLTFFSLAAIAIMIADHRFQMLSVVRYGISAVLTPIEQAMTLPGAAVRGIGAYFSDQQHLLSENRELRDQVLALAAQSQQAKMMLAEKNYADLLAEAGARFSNRSVPAEIIRDARNPFARKIIINKGTAQGLSAGLAVIGGNGVVGQLTSVGLMSAEVTLTTEKDQSEPVMVVRNGLRALAVGTGREGTIDVPFIPLGADIQVGDALVTSGIDGTYPAGLAVATVTQVEKNPAFPFAKVSAQPAMAPDHHRFIIVLMRAEIQDYPRPDIPAADKKSPRDAAGPAGNPAAKRDTRKPPR
ncbi:MAG TPA: rod shape-determining protein MreC [Usitatibacteraceae bacterium]